MPTLWYVKDGPDVRSRTLGWGIQVSFLELREAFGDRRVRFLSKNLPPPFNVNVKEPVPSPRHVVIEVKEEDGTDSKFPQSGFYLFLELSPDQAQKLLDKHRDKK